MFCVGISENKASQGVERDFGVFFTGVDADAVPFPVYGDAREPTSRVRLNDASQATGVVSVESSTATVFRVGAHAEVFSPVVKSVKIQMVDDLRPGEWSPQDALHNQTMEEQASLEARALDKAHGVKMLVYGGVCRTDDGPVGIHQVHVDIGHLNPFPVLGVSLFWHSFLAREAP